MIVSSKSLLRICPVILVVLCFVSLFMPVQAKDRSDRSSMLRIVCVTALNGHDEYILASRNQKGTLREIGKVKLRSSLITEWMEVAQGELDLCVRVDKELVSKCRFTYPKGARRVILILQGDSDGNDYIAQVIDTAKEKFGIGDVLILNSAAILSTVKLGDKEVEAKTGEFRVAKPSLDNNGMLRTLVTYQDEAGKVITCHDIFTPGNKTGRDLLILTSDPQLGIRVTNLSESGPFE